MNFEKNILAFNNLKNKPKPDAIIYDWDNTLVDTWPLIHKALNLTLEKFGFEKWSLSKVKDQVHKSMRESFPEMFGENWQEIGEFYVNSYRQINLDELFLLDSARELLEIIAKKNISQFVVSNKIGKTLRKEAKKLEVDDLFFSLIGASDAKKDKPSTDPVKLALSGSEIDLQKDNVWFIGDSLADVDCAYNCLAEPIIFGCDNKISKTIPENIWQNGKNNEGAIASFFHHQELIKIIDSF